MPTGSPTPDTPRLRTPVHVASAAGDVAPLCAAVDTTPSRAQCVDQHIVAPVHVACSTEADADWQCLSESATMHAELNLATPDGRTPAQVASEQRNRSGRGGGFIASTVLTDAGADLSRHTWLDVTPLLSAARAGDVCLVEALLEAKASIADVRAGSTPLTPTDMETDEAIITPLLAAVLHGHTAVVRALVRARADVQAVQTLPRGLADSSGGPVSTSPLHAAAVYNRAEVLCVLLEANAQPNLVNSGRRDTPLLLACQAGHQDIVAGLIAGQADVTLSNAAGETAVLVASRAGHAECLAALLRAKPGLTRGVEGRRAVAAAFSQRHLDCLALLAATKVPLSAEQHAVLAQGYIQGHIRNTFV